MLPESTGLKLNPDKGAAATRTPTLRFQSEARLGSDARLPIPLPSRAGLALAGGLH